MPRMRSILLPAAVIFFTYVLPAVPAGASARPEVAAVAGSSETGDPGAADAAFSKARRPIPVLPSRVAGDRGQADRRVQSKPAPTAETPKTAALPRSAEEGMAYSISFPLILQNQEWSTRLGVVNPHAGPAELDLSAWSSAGGLLATVHVAVLAPAARLYQEVDDLFAALSPEQLAGIARIEATSDRQLQGFAEYNAADGQRKMFAEAVLSPADRLYIPHIAAEVPELWYTRASLAAGVGDSTKTLRLGTGARYPIAGLADDASQAAFDLNSYFQNGLEAGQAVGEFRSSDTDLGGVVYFGRSDDFQVASALTLRCLPTRTLYYSHVAQDDVWWTGFTIFNVSSQAAHITVFGYDEAGNLTGQNLVEIAPRVKRVAFVGDFIGANPTPAYVIMQSDQPVIGFELFGGHSAPIMAGINAGSVTSKTLHFNHVQLGEDEWTGITMINSGAAAATVAVYGYDDQGAPVATGSTTLAPRQKWVRFVQDLFDGPVPATLSHLRVESDQPLSGFELVGDNALTRLDGLPAVPAEYGDATAVVTAAGATLAVGEANVTLPAGVLAAGTMLTLSERPLDSRSDGDTELAGSATYSLQPENLGASSPFTLTLPQPASGVQKQDAAGTRTGTPVIHRWDPLWQSWEPLPTEPGDGILVTHATMLGVYAVGQTRDVPDLSITMTFDVRPGQFMTQGWLIIKKPPQFGMIRKLGDVSDIYTQKYLPYMQRAAGGVVDDDTLTYTYVSNLNQPYVLDAPELLQAARGQALWCFFVPTSDSVNVSACGAADEISCWTVAISDAEYAVAQGKRCRVIILPLSNQTTHDLGYFGNKTHFNTIAIDEPPVYLPTPGVDPVLLVPGIQGIADYWGESLRNLRSAGFNTYAMSHMGWESLPNTAQMVKVALDYVRSQHSGQEVDLIAHSSGGAVARHYCLVTEPSTSGSKIDDLILIAPLSHGSLAAARCVLGDTAAILQRLPLGVTTDPNLPVFRGLTPASPELAQVGGRAFPSGVDPLVLAGAGAIAGVDPGHVEGELCEDGMVSVPGASLLNALTPVRLGIIALNHIEQPVNAGLFNVLVEYLVRTDSPGFPVGGAEVVRYLWNSWQDVAEDPADQLMFNPYAAGVTVDTSNLGLDVAAMKFDADWDSGSTGVPLVENPENPGVFYYRSIPPGWDSGSAVDLEGSQTRTCTLRLQSFSGTELGTLTNVVLHASGTTDAAPSSPPVIHSFSANPASILAGATSTLSWSVSNATAVSIYPGIGVVGLTGSQSVSPASNTTYVLTATQADISLVARTGVIVRSDENPGELWGVDSIVGELYRVPAGSFSQGSPSSEACRDGDETQFTHTLSRPLAVMATEVTQGMWAALQSVQPSLPDNQSYFTDEANPVEMVTWYEAVLCANLLSLQQGLEPCYFKDAGFTTPVTAGNYTSGSFFCSWNANGYRLPTEGEWERLTRAGTNQPFSVFEPDYDIDDCETCSPEPALDALDSVAWWCHNAGDQTRPSGSLNPNPWGLHDVHGNVWEWCWDWYGPYPTSGRTDYRGPASGSDRVLRGGSWYNLAGFCRSAYRTVSLPGERSGDLGFRLVRRL